MATQAEGSQAKAKAKVSPLRNVLALLLLIALSVVAYMEWNANRQYNAASAKLDKALAKEEGDMLPQDEVEKMIGKKPDGPLVEEKGVMKARYTWRGVFKTHGITAEYRKGEAGLAQLSVEVNDWQARVHADC